MLPREYELASIPTEALVQELLRRPTEILTPDGLVRPQVWPLATHLRPIPGVDAIPVRLVDETHQIGVIIRATGPEVGKMAILGGGVNKNESKRVALYRHLWTDLGITDYRLYGSQTENTPFFVQEYFHGPKVSADLGYDPTKHSIANTYMVVILGEPIPQREANQFLWINEQEIPQETAYNHGLAMRAAFDYLRNHPKENIS